MKFRSGDTVRFRDEKGEGIITGLPGDGLAVVLLPEGIEIPVPLKNLIKVEFDIAREIKSFPLQIHKNDRSPGKKAARESKTTKIYEVDLHIGQLVERYKGMSNGEIITIQLNHFQYWMDKALRENIKSLVFIHGVGNGILKREIRRLATSYPGTRFEDASYRRYGFGATEVIFY